MNTEIFDRKAPDIIISDGHVGLEDLMAVSFENRPVRLSSDAAWLRNEDLLSPAGRGLLDWVRRFSPVLESDRRLAGAPVTGHRPGAELRLKPGISFVIDFIKSTRSHLKTSDQV